MEGFDLFTIKLTGKANWLTITNIFVSVLYSNSFIVCHKLFAINSAIRRKNLKFSVCFFFQLLDTNQSLGKKLWDFQNFKMRSSTFKSFILSSGLCQFRHLWNKNVFYCRFIHLRVFHCFINENRIRLIELIKILFTIKFPKSIYWMYKKKKKRFSYCEFFIIDCFSVLCGREKCDYSSEILVSHSRITF